MAVLHLIPTWVRQRVPRTIKDWLRRRGRSYPVPVYDIGTPPPYGHLAVTDQSKRALLSYLTTPFRLSPDDPRNIHFSNVGIARSIVRVLNELGYIVDVVEWTDTEFLPRRHYDLFIGHGGHTFEHITRNLSPDTVRIYFSTGVYWKEFNQREAERFTWLEQRRGAHLPHDRWIEPSEEYANSSADAIICLGNESAKETYSQFPRVTNLNIASYPDDYYGRSKKDFASARSKFLFFSGGGNVHKGLDLLLEAFVQVDTHLYICQGIRPEFYTVYEHELKDFPTIHLIGMIPMRSSQFYELVDKCAFVIHPSCAEGQPGSVVECMHQGLVPVVSRETNIDTKDFGITLNNCAVEEIIKVVQDLSQRPADWVKEMSLRTRRAAVTEFSEGAFLQNYKDAIQHVIAYREYPEGGLTKARIDRDSSQPFFVDEHRTILVGREARMRLQSKSDERYLQEARGVIEVPIERWEEAQRYERRTWLEGSGRKTREDRNVEHARNFDNYAVLKGHYFDSAIEIGCGPFTNMVHILKHVKGGKVTLLDPLIDAYLTHPHCTYKHKRLGGWFGEKVHTVAEAIEVFSTDQMFDLMVMINVLEHCFSASRVLERVASLTLPSGILIFHDKVVPTPEIEDMVRNVYDAGHPLRVARSMILEFLSENYIELYRKRVPIPTPIGTIGSIYFIGRKRVER